MSGVVKPGSLIGMLGGGQLGRMSLLAGRRMGYRFVVLEPKEPCAAGAVAERQLVAAYDDEAALREMAETVDVVTLEFENIPERALDILEERVPVRPGRKALRICQNRGREKSFLRDGGFPCADHELVESAEELEAAVARIGYPCVLKTADFGYDGKGQQKLEAGVDLRAAWKPFAGGRAVVEKWIPFVGEYSVVCGRSVEGQVTPYPLIHNTHRDHILNLSRCPAGLDGKREREAQELASGIAEALELVGLVAVELFLTESGWLVNELAPRPHNSGHLTLDASATSQFEQHIRLVCGWPAGDPRLLQPACMLNLIGGMAEPPVALWRELLSEPMTKLHLYDKGEARPGRKMGHICFPGERVEDCLQRAKIWDARLREAAP